MKNAVIEKIAANDFLIHIKSIEFDFDCVWQEEYETEQEWLDYQRETTNKYQNFSILFKDYDFPEEEEDETIEGNEDLKGCEESFYYRKLERWIDEEIGWCLLGLDYEVKKPTTK